MTADPALGNYLNGAPNGGVHTPRNIALYGYGYNNPATLHDPNGLWPDGPPSQSQEAMRSFRSTVSAAKGSIGNWLATPIEGHVVHEMVPGSCGICIAHPEMATAYDYATAEYIDRPMTRGDIVSSVLGIASILPFFRAAAVPERIAAESASVSVAARVVSSKGGEEAIRLFHGTSANIGSKIVAKGFRSGSDGAVYFAEEFNTATHFAREAAARTGARSINTLEFKIPRDLAQKLGLMEREVLGAARGAKPIDIPGGSGFERILSGSSVEAFNEALANGTIVVRRLRPPY